MLFRLPNPSDTTKYAVDTEGRLILAQMHGTGDDYVIYGDNNPYYSIILRSDLQIPAFEEWGTASIKAVLTGNTGDFEIEFDGQTYYITDDGMEFTPELEDYQP